MVDVCACARARAYVQMRVKRMQCMWRGGAKDGVRGAARLAKEEGEEGPKPPWARWQDAAHSSEEDGIT